MDKVSVRYIVTDVDAAIQFYTGMLGFKLDLHPAPGFARLSKGNLLMLLNRPGAGGAGQTLRGSQAPAPGGWNRVQLEVEDIEAAVARLKASGCRFRDEIVIGNGGKQTLLEDPSGNPIELFEPFRVAAGGRPGGRG
jgi:catechol 2,3-dioxygenase-like lactoylglutathione lyase family enzyme